ncbi:MAG: hypothetical protein GEV08_18715 [Acidimicrobiia bacterium]|nr:hypothetical protein [Acidimicrobiia bacterium]
MSDEADLEGFGYHADARVVGELTGVQVAEAKHPDTLEPRVVLYLRPVPDAEQVGFAMPPEIADQLADELKRWAQRARDKHFE